MLLSLGGSNDDGLPGPTRFLSSLNTFQFTPLFPCTEAELIQRCVEIARQHPLAENAGVEYFLTRTRERQMRGDPEMGLLAAIEDAGMDPD
jgi:hypothetical protein